MARQILANRRCYLTCSRQCRIDSASMMIIITILVVNNITVAIVVVLVVVVLVVVVAAGTAHVIRVTPAIVHLDCLRVRAVKLAGRTSEGPVHPALQYVRIHVVGQHCVDLMNAPAV